MGTKKYSLSMVLAAAAASAGLTPSSASAALLTYDLRVAGTGGKSVTVTAVGQTVDLELYAVVQNGNANAADDGFLQGMGSFRSSSGGVLGNLRGDPNAAVDPDPNNVSPFNAASAQGGSAVDLDGDTDLDVGSLTDFSSATPYFQAVAASTQLGQAEWLIGVQQFTVTSLGDSSGTTLQFVPRVKTDGTVTQQRLHRFTTDGTATTLEGNNANLAVGAPVTLVVPEPAAAGLAAVAAGLGLLARRRRARGV